MVAGIWMELFSLIRKNYPQTKVAWEFAIETLSYIYIWKVLISVIKMKQNILGAWNTKMSTILILISWTIHVHISKIWSALKSYTKKDKIWVCRIFSALEKNILNVIIQSIVYEVTHHIFNIHIVLLCHLCNWICFNNLLHYGRSCFLLHLSKL